MRDEWRSVGARKLDLGSFSHRADRRNSRDRSGNAGPGEFEDPSPDSEPAPWSTVFRLLNILFQTTVGKVENVGIPITIAK